MEIFKKTLQTLAERGDILAEKDIVRASSYSQNLSANDKQILERLQKIYETAKLEVPTLENALNESIIGTNQSLPKREKSFNFCSDWAKSSKLATTFISQAKSSMN